MLMAVCEMNCKFPEIVHINQESYQWNKPDITPSLIEIFASVLFGRILLKNSSLIEG